MIDPERIANAAYHKERVASRKLAARSSISEPDALRQILENKAGASGIDALIHEREAETASLTARRDARLASRLSEKMERLAAQRPDPARWNAWFDGSARPNPGPCAIGGLLLGPSGEMTEVSRTAGQGSSSEAEYLALLAILEAAHGAGATQLTVHGDSRVVLDDIAAPPDRAATSLSPLRTEVLRLAALIGDVRFHWIPRHRNEAADKLAQQGHHPWT